MGGKRGLAKEVTTHATAQCVGPVQTGEAKVRLPEPLAARRVTTPARPAAPAGLVGKHHMVAGLDSLHRLADSFHHAGAFVPQHDRAGSAAIAEINVGMANPAGHHAHQHLVIARTFHFQALDLQWAARRPQHGGSNGDDGLLAPVHNALVFALGDDNLPEAVSRCALRLVITFPVGSEMVFCQGYAVTSIRVGRLGDALSNSASTRQ